MEQRAKSNEQTQEATKRGKSLTDQPVYVSRRELALATSACHSSDFQGNCVVDTGRKRSGLRHPTATASPTIRPCMRFCTSVGCLSGTPHGNVPPHDFNYV